MANKRYIYAIYFFAFVLLCGCNKIKNDENIIKPVSLEVPTYKIEDIQSRVQVNNDNISVLGRQIIDKAVIISKAYPKIEEPTQIKYNAEKLLFINDENNKSILSLTQVKSQLESASQEIEKLKSEIAESKSELSKGMQKILITVYGLCILGLIAGIILIWFNQQKNGIILVGSSASILGCVYFLQHYAWILGIISGVIFIISLIICIARIVKDQKIKRELVQSYEYVKNMPKYESEEKLAVNRIQSDTTIEEIEKIKKNIVP